MPYFRVAQRAVPIRPVLPKPQVPARLPTHHKPTVVIRNQVPQHFPVLQPPIYLREPEFYEEEQQQYEEIYYPTVTIHDQHGSMTQQFSNQIGTYISAQNYSKQQSNRRAKHRHPPSIYYNR